MVAVCAAIGAVIDAAMNDMGAGFAWGITAGAALGSGIYSIWPSAAVLSWLFHLVNVIYTNAA